MTSGIREQFASYCLSITRARYLQQAFPPLIFSLSSLFFMFD